MTIDAVRAVDTLPPAIAVALSELQTRFTTHVSSARTAIATFGRRREQLSSTDDLKGLELDATPEDISSVLTPLAEKTTSQSFNVTVDGTEQQIATLVAEQLDLQGRLVLQAAKDALEAEVQRLRERARIESVRHEADTTWITRRSIELARDHVTDVIRDQFTRRTDRLKLERVTLKDAGGQKGQLRHRPAFLGAAQEAEVREVLSEGEQTALGIAGFLTEAFFEETHSTMVLDDPVTSLDHIRRSLVAEQLAEFGRRQPVVVFSHDLTFVGDLRKAAEAAHVPFTERSVEKRSDGSIGVCLDIHPWKARDVPSRLHQLGAELGRLTRESKDWDSQRYEKEVADWAGSLSETWERIISLEIANKIVDRSTSEVRPRQFRILARITEADNEAFQQSYSRCSLWLRRHDKSPEVNYVAPDIDALERELALVQGWFERVRKYDS